MNKLHAIDEPVDYLVSLNAPTASSRHRAAPDGLYDHPEYTPTSVAAQRRLPELNTGRTAFAGAYHGWGSTRTAARRASGRRSRWAAGGEPGGHAVDWTPTTLPALVDVRVWHRRSHPLENAFEYGGYPLARRPRRPARAAARSGVGGPVRRRDHLGDPGSSIKANVVASPRCTGGRRRPRGDAGQRPQRAARVQPAVHPLVLPGRRLPGLHRRRVHNTYGERHAYLLHPDDAGRTETEKDFYVSPFNTVDGRYLMRFTGPGEQLHVTMALQVGDRTPFVATLRGGHGPRAPAPSSYDPPLALMSLWVAALIRWQGIRLWARRLPVVPRPAHDPPAGVATNTPRQKFPDTIEDRS